MSRLTGSEARGLMEAYNAVYAPLEKTDQENAEQLDEVVLKGYDGKPISPTPTLSPIFQRKSSDAAKLADDERRTPRDEFAGARNNTIVNRKPAPTGQTVAAAGGKGGSVTVGTKYAATQGGVQGNVTYDASGKKTFTPNTAATPPKPTGTPAPTGTPPSTPAKPTPMDQFAKANPKLAAAAAERARIRGTSQTDNPLMKDMRDRLPLTPSVQSPTLAKDLGSGGGNQSLLNNPNAAKAAPPKPAATPSTSVGFNAPRAGSPPPSAAYTGPGPKLDAATPATPAAAPNKSAGNTPRKQTQTQSFDLFDVIKGHLLDEGYADNEDAALAIMANMSEDWKQSIVEQEGFRSDGRYQLPDGRHMGPIPGAIRALFTGNLPKSRTYVPPSTQTPTNRAPSIPASKGDDGQLTDFGKGGGKEKMKRTGMTVGQVERLGRRNMGDYSN